jgi:hypothetical protein
MSSWPIRFGPHISVTKHGYVITAAVVEPIEGNIALFGIWLLRSCPMLTTLADKVEAKNAAVVVIDMQNAFCHAEGAAAKNGANLNYVQEMAHCGIDCRATRECPRRDEIH